MSQENQNSNSISGHNLFFIDSNNVISQCYHAAEAIGPRVYETTLFLFMKKIFQFRKMINKAIIIFFFDDDHSYRNDIYPWYKAYKKSKTEENLKHSIINKVKEMLPFIGFQVFCQHGYEADDMIAAYVSKYSQGDHRIVIFSSDEDLFQLSKDKVHFYHPVKDAYFTKREILNKYGIKPFEIPIRKALVGKKNEVDGFPGIGAVTANKIINKEIPFPDIDMDLFNDYISVSLLPFVNQNDKIRIEDINIYQGKKDDFKNFFSSNNMEYFLNEKQFKTWISTFKLK